MPEQAALITALILDRPMCLPCIASKATVSVNTAESAVQTIESSLVLRRETGRCIACGAMTTVLSVGLRLSEAMRPMVPQPEALWRFLESRRGEMFCTSCLATSMDATKRLDRAVLGAEARGAQRRYGTCSACGKERLLCGLASN